MSATRPPSAKMDSSVRFERSPTRSPSMKPKRVSIIDTNLNYDRSPSKQRSPSKSFQRSPGSTAMPEHEEYLKSLQAEVSKAKKDVQTREREEAEQRAKGFRKYSKCSFLKKKGVDRILLYNRLDRQVFRPLHSSPGALILFLRASKANAIYLFETRFVVLQR
eukprot:2384465-Pyramimonas_sp.AAC.1